MTRGRRALGRLVPVALGLLAGATLAPVAASAGEADVVAARAECAATCRFVVSVRHADTGWQHYADRFEVLGPDGRTLATRVLRHPHVDEQPFTRTLEDVRLPEGVERVRVRAGDSRHGFGGAELEIAIER
jgi:hypothetical protein